MIPITKIPSMNQTPRGARPFPLGNGGNAPSSLLLMLFSGGVDESQISAGRIDVGIEAGSIGAFDGIRATGKAALRSGGMG
jgi:hypothetical protein